MAAVFVYTNIFSAIDFSKILINAFGISEKSLDLYFVSVLNFKKFID